MGSIRDAIQIFKLLYKAMKQGDKITKYLKKQQSKGLELSPRLRNAIAMYDLAKKNPPDSDAKDLEMFEDHSWYYLDILSELEANPDLVPDNLAEAYNTYSFCVKRAQELHDKDFDKRRAKWEKKYHKTYQPKPRPNLIGVPLD